MDSDQKDAFLFVSLGVSRARSHLPVVRMVNFLIATIVTDQRGGFSTA